MQRHGGLRRRARSDKPFDKIEKKWISGFPRRSVQTKAFLETVFDEDLGIIPEDGRIKFEFGRRVQN